MKGSEAQQRYLFPLVLVVTPFFFCSFGKAQVPQPRLGQKLGISSYSLHHFDLPPGQPPTFSLALDLGGTFCAVRLHAFSMRSRDFEVWVPDASGNWASVTPPPVCTYRGKIENLPGSQVAASLWKRQVHASVILPDGTRWFVQPLNSVIPGRADSRHVVYESAHVVEERAECAVTTTPRPASSHGSLPLPLGTPGLVTARIAFDADFEFYVLNGSSVADTIADIETIMNQVALPYLSRFSIRHSISGVVVRTQEPDPYNSMSAVGLLVELQEHWNLQTTWRDCAHLMTGKDLPGPTVGIARQGTICVLPERAYGVSRSRYSTNLANRTALTAHELGHNWDARHCDGLDCGIMCAVVCGCDDPCLLFGAQATIDVLQHKTRVQCFDNAPGVFHRGDANGDGVVSGLVDGIFLLNYSFVPNSPAPQCFDAADADDDGYIAFVDGYALLQMQFTPGSPRPPYPGPDECGTDLTLDPLDCEIAPPCL